MPPVRKKSSAILEVRALPSRKTQGILTLGSITVPCALGRSGLTRRKREGDGATPVGCFELLNVVYRADREPHLRTGLPISATHRADGWCDDPRHPRYNRPVELPFPCGHEKMWRDDPLYDIVVVLDYNMHPPVPGLGSAIFFHIAREGYSPTEGCVAVAAKHMRALLSHLGPGDVMSIVAP